MKFETFPLTPKQKAWLIKLVEHENKGWWVSADSKEEEKIRWIILQECYSHMERVFLNEIVSYYKESINEYGTLDNPRQFYRPNIDSYDFKI